MLTRGHTVKELSMEGFYEEISTKPKPKILLAAPYVNSFVHETIQLVARELEQVDSRVLPFSITDREHRLISSIKLNDKKAVTIHSHLSTKGQTLLNSIKNRKISASWHPAVSFMIKNILSAGKEDFSRHSILRVYFQDELIQARWQGNQPRFRHITNWHHSQSFSNKNQYVDQLLQDSTGTEKVTAVNINGREEDTENDDIIQLDELFFSSARSSKVKATHRTLRKESINWLKYITINRVLTVVLAFCFIWAGLLEFKIAEKKEYQISLKMKVEEMIVNTDRLSEIAKVERKYFQLQSLIDAVEQTKFNPNKLFEVIESSLPATTWIFQIHATPHEISIDLLDEKNTEMSKLIETLNRQIGKTSLELNEKTVLENHSLNKYTIKIQPSFQNIAHE